MVAYSYRERFIAPIQAEIKTQTMRNERERHARPGEDIQHYFAMRTKHCRAIGVSVCMAVTPVQINFEREEVAIGSRPVIRSVSHLDAFSIRDGFKDWPELREFWRLEHGVRGVPRGILRLPAAWSGVLIEWVRFRLPGMAPSEV